MESFVTIPRSTLLIPGLPIMEVLEQSFGVVQPNLPNANFTATQRAFWRSTMVAKLTVTTTLRPHPSSLDMAFLGFKLQLGNKGTYQDGVECPIAFG